MTRRRHASSFVIITGVLSGVFFGVGSAGAQSSMSVIAERSGWVITKTGLRYDQLQIKLEDAIKANKMGLVNSASASEAAKAQGFEIPGNRVIGVYRNDFARRMLAASVASGIEAPIRIYVTEDVGGGATLSYKTPTAVFAPYFEEGGEALKVLAGELDVIFSKIAATATSP